MSKLHYTIDSRQKVLIEKKSHGKIDIVVKDVVRLEENRTLKLDCGNFINNLETKQRKFTYDDLISCFLYSFSVILLVILLALLAFSKDLNLLNYSYIDNIIGFAALLFSIASIPRVKEFLGRWIVGSKFFIKTWYIIMILCLPFYIVLAMKYLGISNSISNICGIIGIIISILTW